MNYRLHCVTPGSTIFYTVECSPASDNPVLESPNITSSNLQTPNNPVQASKNRLPILEEYSAKNKPCLGDDMLPSTITLKAVAVCMPDMCCSSVVEMVLKAEKLEPPVVTFDRVSGLVSIVSTEDNIPGIVYKYTTDGTTPSINSLECDGNILFDPASPIDLTFQCKAFRAGFRPSEIARTHVLIEKVEAPTAIPSKSKELDLSNPIVTLNCSRQDAQIRYHCDIRVISDGSREATVDIENLVT